MAWLVVASGPAYVLRMVLCRPRISGASLALWCAWLGLEVLQKGRGVFEVTHQRWATAIQATREVVQKSVVMVEVGSEWAPPVPGDAKAWIVVFLPFVSDIWRTFRPLRVLRPFGAGRAARHSGRGSVGICGDARGLRKTRSIWFSLSFRLKLVLVLGPLSFWLLWVLLKRLLNAFQRRRSAMKQALGPGASVGARCLTPGQQHFGLRHLLTTVPTLGSLLALGWRPAPEVSQLLALQASDAPPLALPERQAASGSARRRSRARSPPVPPAVPERHEAPLEIEVSASTQRFWLSYWASWPLLMLLEGGLPSLLDLLDVPEVELAKRRLRQGLLIFVIWLQLWQGSRLQLAMLRRLSKLMPETVPSLGALPMMQYLQLLQGNLNAPSMNLWSWCGWLVQQRWRLLALGGLGAVLLGLLSNLNLSGVAQVIAFYKVVNLANSVLVMLLYLFAALDSAETLAQGHDTMLPRQLAFWTVAMLYRYASELPVLGVFLRLFTIIVYALLLVAGETILKRVVQPLLDLALKPVVRVLLLLTRRMSRAARVVCSPLRLARLLLMAFGKVASRQADVAEEMPETRLALDTSAGAAPAEPPAEPPAPSAAPSAAPVAPSPTQSPPAEPPGAKTFQRAALTLWSIALDGKAKKFAAAEGSTLPVLSLALTNRLEQLVGAKASAFDLDVTKAQAALQAARDAGSAQQVADASLALAAAQVLVEPNLEKLAEIVELEEDKAGTAVALNILANVHILMGHGKDALRAAKQGLYALRSMGGQKIFEVPLLQTMMSACWLRSDSDEALRCCEEVAGICQEAKVDPVILALADGCTALASLANDEQGPAERKVETALKEAPDLLHAVPCEDLLEKERKRGVKEGVARALLLVSASSEEDEAKAKATEAKQLFGTLRDLAKRAQLASSTASALPVAKESFEAFQGCLVGQGFASSLLTLAYLRQEDAKQAERTSREALTMFQERCPGTAHHLPVWTLFGPSERAMGGVSSCCGWLTAPTPISTEVLVVAAGPAGISAVVALRARGRRVLWVDPEFSSGRLARFGEVPCNTKVDILASRKNFGHPLLNGKESGIDPSTMGWTSLGYCKDVFQMATEQLMQVGVPHLRGKVMTLKPSCTQQKPLASGWEATIQSERGQRSVKSNAVIVATGAHPPPGADFSGANRG
eukprot:g18693.t1